MLPGHRRRLEAMLLLAALATLAGCAAPPTGGSGPAPAPILWPDPLIPPPSSQWQPDLRLASHYAGWAGTPYRYGGTGGDGIDCSGFVQRTYAELYQVRLPRTAAAQRRAGREIGTRPLTAGDLVFFAIEGTDSHVGIYMGNGEFMHAASRRGVVRDRLDSPYWAAHFTGAVRVLGEI